MGAAVPHMPSAAMPSAEVWTGMKQRKTSPSHGGGGATSSSVQAGGGAAQLASVFAKFSGTSRGGPADAGISEEVSLVLKKLLKRSECTKIKAVKDLSTLIDTLDTAAVTAMVPEFCYVYGRVAVVDSDWRVREGVQQCWLCIVRRVGRAVGPTVVGEMGAVWWLCCADISRDVKDVAQAAMWEAFGHSHRNKKEASTTTTEKTAATEQITLYKKKQLELITLCRIHFVGLVCEYLSMTEESLTPTSEPTDTAAKLIAQDTYDRVLHATFSALSRIFDLLSSESTEFPQQWHDTVEHLVELVKAKNSSLSVYLCPPYRPLVRSAACTCFSSLFKLYSYHPPHHPPLPNCSGQLSKELCVALLDVLQEPSLTNQGMSVLAHCVRLYGVATWSDMLPVGETVFKKILSALRPHISSQADAPTPAILLELPRLLSSLPLSSLLYSKQGKRFLTHSLPEVLLAGWGGLCTFYEVAVFLMTKRIGDEQIEQEEDSGRSANLQELREAFMSVLWRPVDKLMANPSSSVCTLIAMSVQELAARNLGGRVALDSLLLKLRSADVTRRLYVLRIAANGPCVGAWAQPLSQLARQLIADITGEVQTAMEDLTRAVGDAAALELCSSRVTMLADGVRVMKDNNKEDACVVLGGYHCCQSCLLAYVFDHVDKWLDALTRAYVSESTCSGVSVLSEQCLQLCEQICKDVMTPHQRAEACQALLSSSVCPPVRQCIGFSLSPAPPLSSALPCLEWLLTTATDSVWCTAVRGRLAELLLTSVGQTLQQDGVPPQQFLSLFKICVGSLYQHAAGLSRVVTTSLEGSVYSLEGHGVPTSFVPTSAADLLPERLFRLVFQHFKLPALHPPELAAFDHYRALLCSLAIHQQLIKEPPPETGALISRLADSLSLDYRRSVGRLLAHILFNFPHDKALDSFVLCWSEWLPSVCARLDIKPTAWAAVARALHEPLLDHIAAAADITGRNNSVGFFSCSTNQCLAAPVPPPAVLSSHNPLFDRGSSLFVGAYRGNALSAAAARLADFLLPILSASLPPPPSLATSLVFALASNPTPTTLAVLRDVCYTRPPSVLRQLITAVVYCDMDARTVRWLLRQLVVGMLAGCGWINCIDRCVDKSVYLLLPPDEGDIAVATDEEVCALLVQGLQHCSEEMQVLLSRCDNGNLPENTRIEVNAESVCQELWHLLRSANLMPSDLTDPTIECARSCANMESSQLGQLRCLWWCRQTTDFLRTIHKVDSTTPASELLDQLVPIADTAVEAIRKQLCAASDSPTIGTTVAVRLCDAIADYAAVTVPHVPTRSLFALAVDIARLPNKAPPILSGLINLLRALMGAGQWREMVLVADKQTTIEQFVVEELFGLLSSELDLTPSALDSLCQLLSSVGLSSPGWRDAAVQLFSTSATNIQHALCRCLTSYDWITPPLDSPAALVLQSFEDADADSDEPTRPAPSELFNALVDLVGRPMCHLLFSSYRLTAQLIGCQTCPPNQLSVCLAAWTVVLAEARRAARHVLSLTGTELLRNFGKTQPSDPVVEEDACETYGDMLEMSLLRVAVELVFVSLNLFDQPPTDGGVAWLAVVTARSPPPLPSSRDPSILLLDEFHLCRHHWRPDQPSFLWLLSAHVLFLLLRWFPSTVRSLWQDHCTSGSSRRMLEQWVGRVASARLVHAEVRAVREQLGGPNLRLRQVGSRALVVVFSDDRNEVKAQLDVRFPESYPLQQLDMEAAPIPGVPRKRQTNWVMSTMRLIRQGVSLHSGLYLWCDNLKMYFEGMEDCPICLSVVHPNDRSLPKKLCNTCKLRFHMNCLQRWFKSSYKNTCPHCQSSFI
eukprot:GHVS01011743.1.p1 GENE.GHVS01011743.1~~GHVS01011743.1.p1  ORF type:complete len:1819 (+),score=305.32 GHVS01011743.1:157-5613(+)